MRRAQNSAGQLAQLCPNVPLNPNALFKRQRCGRYAVASRCIACTRASKAPHLPASSLRPPEPKSSLEHSAVISRQALTQNAS